MAFQYKTSKRPLSSEEENTTLENKLYQWATLRCSQKEYCLSELSKKMQTKGATMQQIERILERLIQEKYVDESRYANAFVSDKIRFDHWGRVKIRYALQQKGIASSLIDEAISNICTSDYQEVLQDFIHQRLKTTKGKSTYDINQKVARAAISRGFEAQLVFDILSLKIDNN